MFRGNVGGTEAGGAGQRGAVSKKVIEVRCAEGLSVEDFTSLIESLNSLKAVGG